MTSPDERLTQQPDERFTVDPVYDPAAPDITPHDDALPKPPEHDEPDGAA